MFVIAVLLHRIQSAARCICKTPHHTIACRTTACYLKSHTGRSFFLCSVKVEKTGGVKKGICCRGAIFPTQCCHTCCCWQSLPPHPTSTSTFLLQSPNMAQGFKMIKKNYIQCMAFGSLLYARGVTLLPLFWL